MMTMSEEGSFPPAEQLLRSARRELRMRERVYPGRVARGLMRPDVADHEIACMRGIIAVLKDRVRDEGAQLELF